MGCDGSPAGSGRALRLDPFALPVRFAASDATADGYLREVELHRTRVVVRRSLAGMRMAINLPVSAYAGRRPALRRGCGRLHRGRARAPGSGPDAAAVRFLRYRRGVAEWRSWGAALGLPLLVENEDGGWREPVARLGGVRIGRLRPRRRRRSAISAAGRDAAAPRPRHAYRRHAGAIAASARSSRRN